MKNIKTILTIGLCLALLASLAGCITINPPARNSGAPKTAASPGTAIGEPATPEAAAPSETTTPPEAASETPTMPQAATAFQTLSLLHTPREMDAALGAERTSVRMYSHMYTWTFDDGSEIVGIFDEAETYAYQMYLDNVDYGYMDDANTKLNKIETETIGKNSTYQDCVKMFGTAGFVTAKAVSSIDKTEYNEKISWRNGDKHVYVYFDKVGKVVFHSEMS